MLKKLVPFTVIPFFLLSTSFSAYSASKVNAVIVQKKNNVEVKYATSLWRPATENFTVRAGSTIRTGGASSAVIEYIDGTKVKIGSRSSVIVLDKLSREIKVNKGNIWYKVTKRSYGMKIHTPSAVASILGTEGGIKIEPSDQKNKDNSFKTRIKVEEQEDKVISIHNQKDGDENSDITFVLLEGSVETTAGNKKFLMKPGDKISFSTQDPNSAVKNNIGVANVRSLIESGDDEADKIKDSTLTAKGDNSSNAMQGGGMIPAAKIVSLKENMNVIRQMVESYYMDENSYPSSLSVLIEHAKKNGYNREIKNPFTSRSGMGESLFEYSSVISKFPQGVVLYSALDCKTTCGGYKILGALKPNTLLTDKGTQPYVLSNK
ncbi:MAG: FecR family protein [Candidatus Sericytochromatia bacterium]